MQAACGTLCYRADISEKFWGFTAVVMEVDPIMHGTHSSLVNLMTMGYVYRIYRPANLSSMNPDIFIGGNARDYYALGDMHLEIIQVPNSKVGGTHLTCLCEYVLVHQGEGVSGRFHNAGGVRSVGRNPPMNIQQQTSGQLEAPTRNCK